MAILWTALVLGLVGSLHCAGMCGPLAFALPSTGRRRMAYLGGRALYNLGRVVTYAMLGAVFGAIGQTLGFVGLQRSLSIAIGVLIVAVVVVGPKRWIRFSQIGTVQAAVLKLRARLSELLGRHGMGTMLGIGLLNGLLPCGLVYAALAGAAATGTAAGGVLYMTLFGFGTVPMMLALSLMGRPVQGGVRIAFQRAVPLVLLMLGALFILRGMALGIPYLSPDVASGACCQ